MSGENLIYPWRQSNTDSDFVSAFLHTSGYDRRLSSEKKGYAKYKKTTTIYGATCAIEEQPLVSYPISEAQPVANCDCSQQVTSGPFEESTDWIPYPQEYEEQLPTPENGCQRISYSVEERSLMNVDGSLPGENPETNIEVPGKTIALHEFLRRMAFTPHYLIQEYDDLEHFYSGGNELSRNTNPVGDFLLGTDFNVPKECVYQPREIDVFAEWGYSSDLVNSSQDPFRQDICQATSEPKLFGPLLRAILEVEGSPFLRAVRGRGVGTYNPSDTSFICVPNEYGAVGPMNLIVGQCSNVSTTQRFQVGQNSLNPDLCSISGAMQQAALKIEHDYSLVESTDSLYNLYASLAERYVGMGGCGDLGQDYPNDGGAKALGNEDYCSYVARHAIDNFSGYCD